MVQGALIGARKGGDLCLLLGPHGAVGCSEVPELSPPPLSPGAPLRWDRGEAAAG